MRRRASGNVPSSIRLDHGDVLVRDGLEYEHCTASELQGPRVNLTYRWVDQHTASCPLAGVVGCVLPTCAQGLVEPSSRWLGEGENKWSSFWGLVLLFVNPCVCPFGQHPDSHKEGASLQWSASILLGGALPFSGSCPLGRGTALATVTTSPIFQGCVVLFPLYFFLGEQIKRLFKSMVFGFLLPLGVLVAKWVPTPCYRDAYSVGTIKCAFWGGRLAKTL